MVLLAVLWGLNTFELLGERERRMRETEAEIETDRQRERHRLIERQSNFFMHLKVANVKKDLHTWFDLNWDLHTWKKME